VSLAGDLLEQAGHLAKRERQRPRQASLRRSVSSSYYAVFHLLTSEASRLVGQNLTPAAAHRIQRWFDHHEMKRVCGMFSTPAPPRSIALVLGVAPSIEIQGIAQSFIQLQEARIEADYDLTSIWTRLGAQQHTKTAQDVFDAWARIQRTHEANVFAIALLSAKLFEKDR
jgi:hypothetical protein